MKKKYLLVYFLFQHSYTYFHTYMKFLMNGSTRNEMNLSTNEIYLSNKS